MNRFVTLLLAVVLIIPMFVVPPPAAAHHESTLTGWLPATRNRAAEIEHRLGRVEGTMKDVDGRLKKAETSIARHETSIAQLEKNVRTATKLTGSLAEMAGVHHSEWPLVVTGFATASSDLTPSMKKVIGEVAGLVKSNEWTVEYVAAFADTRKWVAKDGTDLNVALANDRALAGSRYLEGALGMDADSLPALGRGPTAKFGDQDLNRGLLVHLKRVVPTAVPQSTP